MFRAPFALNKCVEVRDGVLYHWIVVVVGLKLEDKCDVPPSVEWLYSRERGNCRDHVGHCRVLLPLVDFKGKFHGLMAVVVESRSPIRWEGRDETLKSNHLAARSVYLWAT